MVKHKRGIKPEHPGVILKELFLDELNISVTEFADKIGVTRVTVSRLINGHQGITAEMAIRLSKAFRNTPELWLNLQRNFDLWEAEHNKVIEVEAIAY
ncbi:HigA family addiction module antitoxin [Asinibacterium sp. OR53]|uniref:HigA family addiction module antitoxin n=1 Tax=Asinibacterium sp. OR53 TaxID=925409 RepID=UPI0004799755|nr:HigA family addiction module antitoxin [Asinibacterium sp. OR53]